jgi:hypothetical protein
MMIQAGPEMALPESFNKFNSMEKPEVIICVYVAGLGRYRKNVDMVVRCNSDTGKRSFSAFS